MDISESTMTINAVTKIAIPNISTGQLSSTHIIKPGTRTKNNAK